jgi:hypothetical protein
VLGGLRRLLPAAIVVGIALAAPGGAFACGGGPSAVHVYTECVQNAGGNNPTTGGQQAGQGSTPVTVSPQTAHALSKGGRDSRVLAAIVKNPGYGEPNLKSGDAGSQPSALGSAFDLGSGPTALLLALAATALLLLGGSGFRFWRQRHRP